MTASRPNARGSNSTHLRIYNERTILQHLRRAQKASKADLARSAHLTNAAVGAIIHSLEEAHLIEEIGKFHAGGRGQPATLLRPNPKGAFAIGLCLGITSYQVVLIDFSCRPVTKSRSFPYQDDSGASVIDRINASVEDLIRPLSKKEKQRLTGIGLTVPCPQLLSGDAATDDLAASGFPKVADLTARLKDSFSLPVIQETRGLAATTAELFFGLGSQNSDFIYIHVGESIGGALCIDGDIFRGHAGNAAIAELNDKGFAVPAFPEDPQTDEEKDIKARYSKVLGSAVNPVLREGNSDRRAPTAVKNYAKSNPHSMGAWSQASRSHVAHMRGGDFYSGEKSTTVSKDGFVRIEHTAKDGKVTVLKPRVDLLAGEVIDGMFMSKNALCKFFEEQIEDAKDTGILFSLHVKATMMKVSHPIVFGHCVKVFYKDLFEKHGELFDKLGVNPNNGLGSVYDKIASLPESQRSEIERDINACYQDRPPIAMVNSDKGISNLHVPSDVIVDASMPAMLRASGQMWGPDGKLHDTKAVIPESTYATIYQEVINFCKTHGAFDPTTMGTVPNVGLMAQKAEEYGSHDKTFEMTADGTMRIIDQDDNVLIEHDVEEGDIWRMCQTKDAPIRDWVKLAVTRARQSGMPAVFWLDDERAHDCQLIAKVTEYLKDHDTNGLDIEIMSPVRAIRYSMERAIRGLDTISVTGNVLRDYLTDLFPILELGTSAKMLSIVPLMAGGGLFETGAGGSAPKHVQQFVEEGHLRWDSLGEFLALAVSLEDVAIKNDNGKAGLLGKTLDQATEKLLNNGKSPLRKAGQLDNRGSHFYLATYWAEAMANQSEEPALAEKFKALHATLVDSEAAILTEIDATQGQPADIGGYYYPDAEKASAAMCPSQTLNAALAGF